MEFFPDGLLPDQSGILLHESGYLPRNNWWNFPNTLSPFWRLYYNGRAGHRVVFPNVEVDLDPSRIIIIPDHQLFHTVGNGPVPHTWLAFQVALRLAPDQKIPICLRPTAIERDLLSELNCQFTGIGTGNRERVLHLSIALLHLVLSRPELRWQAGVPSEGLQRAIRLVETHFAAPLRIADMARTAGLCPRGFTKAFRRYRGCTPGKFLTQTPLRQAAEMLVRTQESIETVAEKTGFPNRYYFSRVFKQLTGDSPARFRSKHHVSQFATAPEIQKP